MEALTPSPILESFKCDMDFRVRKKKVDCIASKMMLAKSLNSSTHLDSF